MCGFLPVNKKEKKEKLENCRNIKQTLIFYEAPHKLINTLENIYDILGNRKVVLAKELTKIYEEFLRGTVSEILEKGIEPKGEFVIVLEGAEKDENDKIKDVINSVTLEEHMKFYLDKGFEKKEAIKKIAKDRNVSKNEIYQYFI